MKKLEEYKDLCEKIIEKITPKVDYLDVRVGMGVNTSLLMKDGVVDEVNSGNILGASIRILNNGAWGFSYTDDLEKLEQVAENSIKISNSLKGNVKLSQEDIVKDKIKIKAEIPVSDISIEEKRDVLIDVNKSASLDNVHSTTVNYSDNESKSLFLNSEGSNIEIESTRVILALNSVASNGEVIQMGHESMGGVKGFEVIENADIEKFGRETSEKAIRLLDSEAAPSGKFPIITDNLLTGVFIHEALGHATEGDLILQNDSILKGKLGEQIGSDIVNIFDDASLKDGFGYYPYDVEGVKTRPNQLVKDGKLVGLLNSRESGGELEMGSSGNARSSISDQPIVRMSNTYLEPGELSFDELIEDIKEGIYLKGSRGGQVDTGKGIFQFNASEAFKIEKGELTTSLRDVSLSGNILETLNNVNGIGNDFKLSVGYCGKDGQAAPVGDGGPHTRILDALVGGSA